MSCRGKNTYAYDILVGKPAGEWQPGRLYNIKIDLKPYDWVGADRIRLNQGGYKRQAFPDVVMNLRVP
jgi:hypothetical protein